MAELLGVTPRRLGQMADDEGMPKLGRGLYPMKACVRWYIAYWRDRANAKTGDSRLSDKKDLELMIARAKYEEQVGHLISRREVVNATSAGVLRLGKMLDSIPPMLQREFNMPPDMTRLVKARIAEAREGFVHDVQEYIEVAEPAPEEGKKTRARKRAG